MARKPNKPRDFLADAKASREPVLVTGHGVKGWKLFAKPLSAKAMQGLMQSCQLPGKKLADGEDSLDTEKFGLALIGASIVTNRGVRVFAIGQESEMADGLPQRTYTVLQRAALEVNGLLGDGSGN